MSATGYVFDIGGGVAYACQDCHDAAMLEPLECGPDGPPEMYGPTTLDGDAACESCGRFLREVSK